MEKEEIKKTTTVEESNVVLKGNAQRLIGIIGTGWFRIVELTKKSNLSHDQAERAVEQLTVFGFVETESLDGKWCHKVDISVDKRTKVLEKQKAYLQEQIRNSLDRIKLIDLVLEEVAKEAPKKIIEEVKVPEIEVIASMDEVKKEVEEIESFKKELEK